MFKRLINIIRSFFNNLLTGAEKKVTISSMELALREIHSNLGKYKESVAKAIAYEKKAERKYQEEKQRYERLTQQALTAAKQSLEAKTEKERIENENLAKRALQLRKECEKRVELFNNAYFQAKNQSEEAKTLFENSAKQVEEKARQLKHAKVLDELNKSKREVSEISSKLDIDSAMSVFDKGMERVLDESETLKAFDDLALSEGDKLDEKLEQLTKRDEISSEFDELIKQVSGKSPAKEDITEKEKVPQELDPTKE